MYRKKHFDLPLRVVNDRQPNVAFYGDKVVATDSFRLIEIKADGEPHEPVLYPARLLKAIRLGEKDTIHESQFGIIPIEEHFPKYEELQKTWEKIEYFEFSVNGDYLAEFVSRIGKLSKYKKVVISIPKVWATDEAERKAHPLVIKSVDGTATGYIMPMEK